MYKDCEVQRTGSRTLDVAPVRDCSVYLVPSSVFVDFKLKPAIVMHWVINSWIGIFLHVSLGGSKS